MSMTPIHRIPQGDSGMTLATIVSMELGNCPKLSTQAILQDLIAHDSDNDSFGVMMDWAMQIRDSLGISWGESIHAASILYYG